jgi:hypothetical protein
MAHAGLRADGNGGDIMSESNTAPIHDELERARAEFHRLLAYATKADLRGASHGTRWTNRELLFHMLFGYLIVQALLILARLFDRLPTRTNHVYARLLNHTTAFFDVINYLGSRIGAALFTPTHMVHRCDCVITSLHHRLDTETEADLARGMHYPTRWDPFFADYMTIADIYRYPTQHFQFHQQQLTFGTHA